MDYRFEGKDGEMRRGKRVSRQNWKVLSAKPGRGAPAPKFSVFTNEPIRTNGFGGALNKKGYGGGR